MEENDTFSQDSDGVSAFVAGLTGSLEQKMRDELNKQKHQTRVVERRNSALLVRIDKLEQENKGLNEKLASALQSRSGAQQDKYSPEKQAMLRSFEVNCSATVPDTTQTPPALISSKDWSELNRKYHLLKEQHTQRAIAMERLESKLRKYKEHAKEWERYARKNTRVQSEYRHSGTRVPSKPTSMVPPMPEAEIMAEKVTELRQTHRADQIHLKPPTHAHLQKKCAMSNKGKPNSEPPSEPVQEGAPEEPREPEETREAEEPRERDGPLSLVTEPGQKDLETPRQNPHIRSKGLDQCEQGSREPRSSQTTQEDNDEPTQPRIYGPKSQASDDNEQEFIFGRSLKRKRHGVQEGSDFTVFKDDKNTSKSESAGAVHIKEEPEESQSAQVSQILAPHFPTGQALDLDDTGNQLETPRKRREFRKSSNYPHTKRNFLGDVPALRQERSFSAPADLNRLLPRYVRTGRQETSVKAEENHDFDPMHVASQDEENSGEGNGPHPNPRNHRNTKPLGQADANSRVPLLRPQSRQHSVKTHGEQSRGAQANNLAFESGEERAPEREISSEMREESRRRLAGLLCTDRSPEKRILAKPLTPASIRTTRSEHKSGSSKKTPRSEPLSKKPLIMTPQTASRVPQRASKRLLNRNNQPLRSKPLELLGIGDFKINSSANDGVAFAYNQVVRSQEARRCMLGCIKDECCGPTFRALVESGINPPIQDGLWASSQSDQTDDDKFLREYLGSIYNKEAFGLKPSSEQHEILTRAKMAAWAKCCGRHRQSFQRERTPPGFWRTDFPGTQEARSDREAARREERRLLEERWREAMTEGGRWLFRDE